MLRIKDKRNNRIYIRLNDAEKVDIKNKADLSDMSVSEYIRQAAITASVKVNIEYRPNNQQLGELIYELHKIGTNINQIAHKLNSNENYDSVTDTKFKNALSKMNALLNQATAILEDNYGNN